MRDGERHGGILGQPRGVGLIALVEGLASFAIYGIGALLVLYLTRQVLLPDHAVHVAGLATLRAMLERAYGPLTGVALASILLGLLSSLRSVTPLPGALIADRWLGRRPAILLGGVLLIAGSTLLMWEPAILLALLCLLLGVGLFAGNLMAQLGELYPRDDPRRGDGFQILYLGIDAGVTLAPLVCGTLGETLGFVYGFAAAAIGMTAAVALYTVGGRHLRAIAAPTPAAPASARPPIGRRGWATVLVLLLLVPVIGVASVANNQIYGAYELWGDAHYDLRFSGRRMPVTWLISIDALISFGSGFAVLALSRFLEARDRLPNEINRCAIGAALSAGAALILALATASAGTARVSLFWGLAFHVINALGIALLFPVTLALFSRAAPPGLTGTMITSSRLNFFVSFQLVGWLGGLVDTVDGARFWLIHAGIVAGAAIVLFGAGRVFRGLLAPEAAAQTSSTEAP